METILGGRTPYLNHIPEEEFDIFKKALHGLIGVKFIALDGSKQVVNGMNYRFFCNVQIAYPEAPNEAAIVQIHKPLKGDAHITSITLL